MPEFILDTDGVVKAESGERVAFFALPLLAQGYIKAFFWTNTEGSREAGTYDPENGSALPEEVGYDDLAAETLDSILADCAAFAKEADALLTLADERGYGEERAGHDFWLTRNGHGAGFWDRDELEAEGLGDSLTAIAKRYGDSDVYLGDDDKVYCS